MNRAMAWNFLSQLLIVATICALGFAVGQAFHLQLHPREMAIAAIVTLAGAEAAMIPVFIVRDKRADTVAQGALISTMVHMGICAGAGLCVQQMTHPPQAFFYWLCAFYWSTLAGVCRVLVRAVKAAPIPVAR